MIIKRIMKFSPALFLLLLILFGCIFQSCSSTSKNRRGKLSDAMEKSSDDQKGDRQVETKPDPDEYEVYEDDYYIEESVEQNNYIENDSLSNDSPELASEKDHWWLITSGGTGILESTEFYGLNHFNLAFGGYNSSGHHFLELTAGFGMGVGTGNQYPKRFSRWWDYFTEYWYWLPICCHISTYIYGIIS